MFKRYLNNPIITLDDIPYQVHTVFNAGSVIYNGSYLLLLRIEDKRGFSHFTVAQSENGVDQWIIDNKPSLMPDPANYPEELWGIEDPRITYLEELDCYAIAYTSFSEAGQMVSIVTTRDFVTYDRLGAVMPPENKDAALFPVKFHDRWAMIHRPMAFYSILGAHIWISYSYDLKHWGGHQLLIKARNGGWWDANKVGLSPQPLKTDEGWLILYHGVNTMSNRSIYRLGLALLDLENPSKLIARSDEWVFGPELTYEKLGDNVKVVYPCGWVLVNGIIKLYYGGADACIAMASASLNEVLSWLKNYSYQ